MCTFIRSGDHHHLPRCARKTFNFHFFLIRLPCTEKRATAELVSDDGRDYGVGVRSREHDDAGFRLLRTKPFCVPNECGEHECVGKRRRK